MVGFSLGLRVSRHSLEDWVWWEGKKRGQLQGRCVQPEAALTGVGGEARPTEGLFRMGGLEVPGESSAGAEQLDWGWGT